MIADFILFLFLRSLFIETSFSLHCGKLTEVHLTPLYACSIWMPDLNIPSKPVDSLQGPNIKPYFLCRSSSGRNTSTGKSLTPSRWRIPSWSPSGSCSPSSSASSVSDTTRTSGTRRLSFFKRARGFWRKRG